MKFAIIMPLAEQRGGAELMLLHLLRANRQGPQVEYQVAFLEEGPMVAEVQALGYPVQVFQAGHLRQASRFLATVRALKGWMQCEQVEIVISWMAKGHLYGGPAAKMAGIPAIWWQHNIPDRHWLQRLATFIPTERIFCSSQAAQCAQQKLKPKREISVIYPGVDLTNFDSASLPSPTEARRMLGLSQTGSLIGIVARLQRSKGIGVFLEAAAEVVNTGIDANFIIVGGKHALEPDCPELLLAQAKALGISEKVTFTGYQVNTALWMQAMDIIVLASIGTESFGMVIIEGMALGKIVIGTKAGGLLEIIEDGVDGFLTPPGDAAALAETILRVISTPNLPPGLSQAARRKAARFSTERLAVEVARNLQIVVP